VTETDRESEWERENKSVNHKLILKHKHTRCVSNWERASEWHFKTSFCCKCVFVCVVCSCVSFWKQTLNDRVNLCQRARATKQHTHSQTNKHTPWKTTIGCLFSKNKQQERERERERKQRQEQQHVIVCVSLSLSGCLSVCFLQNKPQTNNK